MIDAHTATPAQVIHVTRLRVAAEATLENARVALSAVAISPLLEAEAEIDRDLVERVTQQLVAGIQALRDAENATKDVANARWADPRPARRGQVVSAEISPRPENAPKLPPKSP